MPTIVASRHQRAAQPRRGPKVSGVVGLQEADDPATPAAANPDTPPLVVLAAVHSAASLVVLAAAQSDAPPSALPAM
ncbi:hypothetical protein ACIBSW_29310 [Actinoplanes sp. NPDC049668]|uniref:hypothetical protein n=1 Tax=unclassified Actinoplanes TaxID=2626549 RepID=UPI0033A62BBD